MNNNNNNKIMEQQQQKDLSTSDYIKRLPIVCHHVDQMYPQVETSTYEVQYYVRSA